MEALNQMVASNPDKSPAEIARMASQTDAELAQIISSIRQDFGEMGDAAQAERMFVDPLLDF